MDTIVGIDLGTTNSEIAAFTGQKVEILGPGEVAMLPSCVGLTPSGELLVGATARNQQLLYPERTVRSIKRRMGSDEPVVLGERSFLPQEVSALILRQLVDWAAHVLEATPRKAVISVPAYFSDAQRQATREAGELAGLEVMRLLNEPTAASLAYGRGQGTETVMVYDLGGGTFDVSIVTFDGDVTEVLASHGNNRLGGDDFTDLLAGHLADTFREKHGVDLRSGHAAGWSRLWWAAEEAKKRLSTNHYVRVTEENLIVRSGSPLHLDVELSRSSYDEMIGSLIQSTMDSVSRALQEAKVSVSDLDSILLVGGSSRTPLVQDMLMELTGITPRQEVHPDLCVALGAGVLASRLAGHEVERILVDINPYSFGISYLGDRGGFTYPYCYKPIIHRNTPLPVTRTSRYFTAVPCQEKAEINVFQGDDPDALRNVMIGRFTVEDLTPTREPNEVLCQMKLDLDGILNVSAIEKVTGKTKHVTIADALVKKSPEEIGAARRQLNALFDRQLGDEDEDEDEDEEDQEAASTQLETAAETATWSDAGRLSPDPDDELEEGHGIPSDAETGDAEWTRAVATAEQLVGRSRELLPRMHDEDKEDAIELHTRIAEASRARDQDELARAMEELRELMYFVDGR